MPQASNSVGLVLKIGVTTVAKLTKIGAPEMSRAEIDVTTLDSVGGYKEFIPDFRDGGMLAIEGFAISDAGQDALKSNFDSETNETFTIITPNGITIVFDGYVSKYKKGDAAVSQGIQFSGEIRVSGVVSYAETDSTGCSALTITEYSSGDPLTSFDITPVFATGTYAYTATFNTEVSVQVTATNATALTTIELYIDGVYIEDLTTTVASSEILMSADESKLIQVVTWQTDLAPLTYTIMLGRTS